MRRNKTQSLREVIEDLINEYKIGSRLKEASIINVWNSVTGKAISSRTTRVYIKDGILHIYLNSSVVKNELLMLREALKEQLNKRVGETVVKEIIIH